MEKVLKSLCSCCGEQITITIKDNQIISIQHNSFEVSESELAETLNKLNIELG